MSIPKEVLDSKSHAIDFHLWLMNSGLYLYNLTMNELWDIYINNKLRAEVGLEPKIN